MMKNFSYQVFGLVFLVAFAFANASAFARQGDPEMSSVKRFIDFRIYYPIVSLKGAGSSKRQLNYLGLDLNYEYFWSGFFGYHLDLGGWFIPVRGLNTLGESKSGRLSVLYITTGPAIRFLPNSRVDPLLMGFVGFGGTDAGDIMDAKFVYPMGFRFSVNLYKQGSIFLDNTLSLVASTSAYYLANALPIQSPYVFDAGLSFKGSF